MQLLLLVQFMPPPASNIDYGSVVVARYIGFCEVYRVNSARIRKMILRLDFLIDIL